MNRVKLAVVGVGALGQHHARILSTMPDVHLVGVVDSREQQGRQIAAKHGTQWFASPAQILPLVQGVIIAGKTTCPQSSGRANTAADGRVSPVNSPGWPCRTF